MTSRPSLRVTLLEAAAAIVLFAAIPVIVKFVSAGPFTIGIFRLSIATAGVLAIVAARRPSWRPSVRDLLPLAFIGALFFGHWITYFLAIKASSASIGTIGLSTYGIHLLILGRIFGGTRLHAVDIASVLLAVTGALIVVPSFDLTNEVTVGMLLASLSGLMYASLPILHQRFAAIPNSIRALGQFGFALLLFLLFLPKSRWDLRPIDWAGLTFLAVGSTLIGHTLWVRVTTRLSAAATSVIYYGNVPIAVLLSAALL
ncbi:MAG: DMT family transporter, partial [Thermoanaerobaculia bacterium]